jgi:adenylate cyclase
MIGFNLQLTAQINQPERQAEFDSLYMVWQDETQTDTARAIAFKDFIWNGFIDYQPDTAFIMAEELLVWGIDKNYLKAQAYAHNILATVLSFKGDYTRSLEYYIHSLNIMEQIGDQKGIAKSHFNIGVELNLPTVGRF